MKQLFFVGLMAIAFAGCSGDNAYDNGGGNPIEGDQFMAVKLVMSGDAASTRAFGSAGFEAGTADEVGVTEALFLFFDGETQVADPYKTSELNPWTSGIDQSVDKVSASIIVLSNAIKNPTSIVVILNPTTEISSTVTRNTTLTQLKDIKHDYSQNTYTVANKFVMSNSVYNKGGQNVIGAPCTDANIKKTQAEAKANPVKIAVEKVVAKVSVKQGEGMVIKTNPTEGNNNVNVDGTTKTVTAEITGWWLDNTNPTSYLIKKLETNYPTPPIGADWWNDEANRRSYWATPASTGTFTHYPYTAATPLANDKYCLENTNQETPTQIVVAATLKVDNTAEDLVKFLSVVYTASGFQKELTKQLSNKYYTKTGSSYTPLTEEQLKFTYNTAAGKPYEAEVTVELQSGVSVFTSTNPSDSGSYTQADTAITTDLANLKRTVQYWKGGRTYYYLPIVHNEDITVTATSPAANHKLYGVIRNHLYKLTIKSINGLGTPVPNPDEPTTPITPEKPEDDNSYIAAQIEILKYKVVTQDVDLGL